MGLVEDIQRITIENAIKARDEQIINALSKKGYSFKNRIEMECFLRQRCELLRFPDKCILKVDGKAILEWFDTHRFESDGQKFSVIMGEKP